MLRFLLPIGLLLIANFGFGLDLTFLQSFLFFIVYGFVEFLITK